MANIPPELWLHSFGFLDVQSLGKCSGVSKSWNENCDVKKLWENLFKNTYRSDLQRTIFRYTAINTVSGRDFTRVWKCQCDITPDREILQRPFNLLRNITSGRFKSITIRKEEDVDLKVRFSTALSRNRFILGLHKNIYFYDCITGKETRVNGFPSVLCPEALQNSASNVPFSQLKLSTLDNGLILQEGENQASVWDPTNYKCLFARSNCADVIFFDNKIAFATNRTVQVWDILKNQLLFSINKRAETSKYAGLGDHFILFGSKIICIDLKGNKTLYEINAPEWNLRNFNGTLMFANPEMFVYSNTAGLLKVFDVKSGKELCRFGYYFTDPHDFNNKTLPFAIGGNLCYYVSTNNHRNIRIRNISSGVTIATLKGRNTVQAITLHQDRLVVVYADSMHELWNLNTNQSLTVFKAKILGLIDLHILTISDEKNALKFLDLRTGVISTPHNKYAASRMYVSLHIPGKIIWERNLMESSGGSVRYSGMDWMDWDSPQPQIPKIHREWAVDDYDAGDKKEKASGK